ncbi:MAG TPA: hypothetical protein VGF97_14820 [Rhizomicrobium sp.]
MPALPEALFVASVAILAFLAGFLVAAEKWEPYGGIQDARKTLRAMVAQTFPPFAPVQFLGFSGGDPASVERRRISVLAPAAEASATEHFLVSGGLDQYRSYCPHYGCIAVEFARNGSMVHAYPYRPDSIEAHAIATSPYEQISFRFTENVYPLGLLKLPGGDLIVTFQQWNMFPFAGGIARLRPDGSAVWFRHDYSHHWPTRLSDGDIAVAAMRIGAAKIVAPLGPGAEVRLKCEGKIEEDTIHVLDDSGHVKQEISVFDAFLHSPWRGMLFEAPAPCAPLHLNYVTPVTQGIASLYPDVAPDDFLISLRDVNAFGILGRHDHRLKYVFTGTFLRQHSVQPLGQSSTVLIFDDHGGDWRAGPSRVLAYDLRTGTERTLFPGGRSSGVRMFSDVGGNISLSPGLDRMLVAASWAGQAYEVRLSDGAVLTRFENIDDLRDVEAAGDGRKGAAGRFALRGVYYVH